MKQYTSEAAKSLITIIGTEYQLASQRVERGFIKPDQMLGTLLERLNRLANNSANLRLFLDHGGFIPREEDEGSEYPWAEEPREARHVEVDGKRSGQAGNFTGNDITNRSGS